jgi:hyperosmotically inducible protein
MRIETTRRIVVAGCMAVVVGIGVVTFAMSSHPAGSTSQATAASGPIAQVPLAAPDVAQIPTSPVADAPVPSSDAAAVDHENVGTKSTSIAAPSTAEPKQAPSGRMAMAGRSAVASGGAAPPAVSRADTVEDRVPETIANRGAPLASSDVSTIPLAIGSSAADDQPMSTAPDLGTSDSQITTDVKSAIAGDALGKDANIRVTTTHGVVTLTGSLASQDAIDQVKGVAGHVKDVKSVDTSGLILASL